MLQQTADIDFSKASICTVTLSDGSTITLSGTAVGEKRWIQVTAPKDAALSAKTNGRAFEIASYRYDNIFRPLEQMLVPKPVPPSAKPAAPAAAESRRKNRPPRRSRDRRPRCGLWPQGRCTGLRRVSAWLPS